MYDPYFTLKILRSSPRRHRGERTTTIPMKTPPLPVEFAVDGCFILCGGWESVPCKMGEMCYTEIKQKMKEGYHMTDQELLQAIREITREEIQASESRIKKETIILMDAEFGPKFNLLAENQDILLERLDRLERKVDGLEDKVLEHDFRLKIIK